MNKLTQGKWMQYNDTMLRVSAKISGYAYIEANVEIMDTCDSSWDNLTDDMLLAIVDGSYHIDDGMIGELQCCNYGGTVKSISSHIKRVKVFTD